MYCKIVSTNPSRKHKAENAGGYLKCAVISALDTARQKACWQGLESVLSDAVSRVKQTAIGKVRPANFGFKRILSQSGSHANPVTSISEAMDVVIFQDESHRELI